MSDAKPLPRLLLLLPVLLGIALALLYIRGLTFDANTLTSRLVDKSIPAFSLPDLYDADKLIRSHDIKGPAVINVWATWCAACRNEHRLLLEISRNYGVPIYGVDYQDSAEAARDWLLQKGNPFERVMFDGAAASSLPLDIFSLPQTYLVDANGVIRARHIGELTETVWLGMWGKLRDNH